MEIVVSRILVAIGCSNLIELWNILFKTFTFLLTCTIFHLTCLLFIFNLKLNETIKMN